VVATAITVVSTETWVGPLSLVLIVATDRNATRPTTAKIVARTFMEFSPSTNKGEQLSPFVGV
jgi:hypothetical protein